MKNKGGFLYCWWLLTLMDHGAVVLSMAKQFYCIEFYIATAKIQ